MILQVVNTFLLCLLLSNCQEANPIFRQRNDHWQKEQDRKLSVCYQRQSTMKDVEKCLLSLGVYI